MVDVNNCIIFDKNGIWQIKYNFTVNGEHLQRSKSTGIHNYKKRKKPASEERAVINDLAVKFAAEINEKYFDCRPEQSLEPKASIMFLDYVDRWLSEDVYTDLQYNTWKGYRSKVNRMHDYPRFNCPLAEITSDDIRAFFTFLRSEYKKKTNKALTQNTILHYYRILNIVFKRAISDGIIKENPVTSIKPPPIAKINYSTFSPQEVEELIKKVIDDDERMGCVIIIALCLGMRRSEICGLTWKNIDFTRTDAYPHGCISISQKVYNAYGNGVEEIVVSPIMKTASSKRTLPMPEALYDYLSELKDKQDEWRKTAGNSWNNTYNGFVCIDKLGNLITPNYITAHWRCLCKKYGYNVTFHGLRHTFATNQIKSGTELIKLRRWLGHSTISTTANVYSHIDGTDLKDMAERIDIAALSS